MFLKTNNIIVYTSIYLSIRLSVCHQCLGLVFFTPVLVPEFPLWGSRGLMDRDLDLEIWTCNLRLWVRISGLAGIVFGGGGCEQRAFSPPSIPRLRWDPWARHRTPNCSPGAATLAAHCSGCVCVYALGWVKCRAQIPSVAHHTWPQINFFLIWLFSCSCWDDYSTHLFLLIMYIIFCLFLLHSSSGLLFTCCLILLLSWMYLAFSVLNTIQVKFETPLFSLTTT